jgi:hypothetical protein
MLHSKTKLLEMLPLFCLLVVIHDNVWLVRGCGALEVDLTRAPVHELFLGALLYPPYELFHRLQRALVA